MNPPVDFIAVIRDLKEQSARQKENLILKLCDLAEIALPAVYQAAAAGNVTCKVAVREMEKKLRLYEQSE